MTLINAFNALTSCFLFPLFFSCMLWKLHMCMRLLDIFMFFAEVFWVWHIFFVLQNARKRNWGTETNFSSERKWMQKISYFSKRFFEDLFWDRFVIGLCFWDKSLYALFSVEFFHVYQRSFAIFDASYFLPFSLFAKSFRIFIKIAMHWVEIWAITNVIRDSWVWNNKTKFESITATKSNGNLLKPHSTTQAKIRRLKYTQCHTWSQKVRK